MKLHENDMSSAVLCRESKIAKWHQMTYLCKIEQNVILVWNDTKWQEMTQNDMKWQIVKKRKKSAETEKNDVKRRKINDILVNTMTTKLFAYVVKNEKEMKQFAYAYFELNYKGLSNHALVEYLFVFS